MSTFDDVVTGPTAAKLLRVTPQAVHYMATVSGILKPAGKLAGARVYRRADVMALKAERGKRGKR